MYHTSLSRLIATVVLCSLCLQGCQSSFQVTSDDPTLKKLRKASDDEQVPNQVRVPDVQCSVLSDVRHSRLSIATSAIPPATPTVQTTSPMHHLAVTPDTVPARHQASSAALEETDAKSAVRSIAHVAKFSSKQPLNHWGMRPEYPKTEALSLKSSPRAKLRTSEQACELLTVGSEPPRRKDLTVLKREIRALTQARILAEAFGAKEWAQYFGEVGEEPCLPPDIAEILDSACPFWPAKSVRDTHLLVLIPSTVDGKAFTLDLLEALIQNPRGRGHCTRYFLYNDEVQRSSGDVYSSSAYWVLTTRGVLPGSRSKLYTDQQALVTACARETGLSYELPGALEAATVIFSYYVCGGERLYSDALWTYTRCQELLDDQSPVIVGGFKPEGIDVDYYLNVYFHDYGVATCRRF